MFMKRGASGFHFGFGFGEGRLDLLAGKLHLALDFFASALQSALDLPAGLLEILAPLFPRLTKMPTKVFEWIACHESPHHCFSHITHKCPLREWERPACVARSAAGRLAMKGFASALALATLASCGAKHDPGNAENGATAVENGMLAKLDVTSTAIQDGGPIPARYTCDGDGQSPPLSWGEPPAGTKSFALVVDDPDAPSGTFRHWGVYDIPASARSLGAGQSIGGQAVNGFGKSGYGGPCPPKGHGPHHYRFKLYALDIARLGLTSDARVEKVESEGQKHAIGQGQITGIYERN